MGDTYCRLLTLALHSYCNVLLEKRGLQQQTNSIAAAELQEFGVAAPDARRYFKAFDLNDSGVVDYREFLIGLIALDLNTAHGGVLGEQRTLYIFRV
eukprot:SAG22_NODE_8681_length_637_cov_0.925651_2_plen_96_part_01